MSSLLALSRLIEVRLEHVAHPDIHCVQIRIDLGKVSLHNSQRCRGLAPTNPALASAHQPGASAHQPGASAQSTKLQCSLRRMQMVYTSQSTHSRRQPRVRRFGDQRCHPGCARPSCLCRRPRAPHPARGRTTLATASASLTIPSGGDSWLVAPAPGAGGG